MAPTDGNIDFALLARLEDQIGRETVQRLTRRYAENAQIHRTKMAGALAQLNRDEVRFIAHQVHGSAASFGLVGLTRAAAQLEHEIETIDDATLVAMGGRVMALLDSETRTLAEHFA